MMTHCFLFYQQRQIINSNGSYGPTFVTVSLTQPGSNVRLYVSTQVCVSARVVCVCVCACGVCVCACGVYVCVCLCGVRGVCVCVCVCACVSCAVACHGLCGRCID